VTKKVVCSLPNM